MSTHSHPPTEPDPPTSSHRRLLWTGAGLAVLGAGLLIAWVFSTYSYGVYVDAHGLDGESRPQEVVLFASGAGSVIAGIVALVMSQRRSA